MRFRALAAIAEEVIGATQRRLPAAVREPAGAVPVCFEPRPNAALLADGCEPDLLGLFVGPAHDEEPGVPEPLPPQILLFLENLWDFAGGDERTFRSEVRITYLHELGHYLGWDESDLEVRGLD